MDVFIISCIEGYVAGKIEKVPRLYLRQGNFMNGIAFHNGGVPVNENSAHIVTHKGKTGTVKAFMGFSAPVFGFYTVYSFLFLAMGRAVEGCILGACRQGLCFVPVILILPALRGLSGVLYAQPAADVLSAAAAALMALRLRRELGASEASAPPREG